MVQWNKVSWWVEINCTTSYPLLIHLSPAQLVCSAVTLHSTTSKVGEVKSGGTSYPYRCPPFYMSWTFQLCNGDGEAGSWRTMWNLKSLYFLPTSRATHSTLYCTSKCRCPSYCEVYPHPRFYVGQLPCRSIFVTSQTCETTHTFPGCFASPGCYHPKYIYLGPWLLSLGSRKFSEMLIRYWRLVKPRERLLSNR